ncbi:hypothetical protein E4N87_09750 [Treponema denticola]|uniref:MORN repeat protein n=1 Tax=Treponema denticola TaxID=158 RepID=A0A9Q9BKX4_TREDN|nr:hypothetical protein [Treponema denticola]UTC90949.1 hypothetical protein E4N87_09750 [Treponema denticola]UTC99698.1 hypothetical protein E4N86_02825 [Treponema denticola]
MSLKKILCFVFILYSLFIFADGSENSDVQSPPVTETENQNLPATENADTTVPSGTETENQNLSENEKDPEEYDRGFYSIQSSGLTTGFGDRWFFEQLDDNGRPLISVLYEKDKLIEKKTYTYTDGYPESCEVVLPDKLIKIKYNQKRMETEKTIYDAEGKNELEKNIYTYNENNLLIESFLKKEGTEYISKYEYGPENKPKSKTDFVNGNKISYTEYMTDKKIVHLFEYGKEVGVIEEEI